MLQESSNRDQFIADVAVKLERLRVAVANIEDAIPEWRDLYTALKEKVDLVLEVRCCDLENRLAEYQHAIDTLSARQGHLELATRQVNDLRTDIVLLNRRLSDPTRGVSYATHEVISKLGRRLEIVEQHTHSAIRGRRRFMALAAIAAVAVTWGILSETTPLRRISSAVGAGLANTTAAR
jgi:hypothetical protein